MTVLEDRTPSAADTKTKPQPLAERSGESTPPLDRTSGEHDRSFALSPQRSTIGPLDALPLNSDFDALSIGQGFGATPRSDSRGGSAPHTLSRQSHAFTKLECFNARDINASVIVFNVIVGVSVFFSVISMILAHAAFSESTTLPRVGLIKTWAPWAAGAAWFELMEAGIVIFLFAYAVLLWCGYLFMIARRQEIHVTNEQVWTGVLLFLLAVYMNPYDSIIRIRAAVVPLGEPTLPAPPRAVVVLFACIRVTSFTFASLLYVWFTARSYSMLTERVTWKSWGFYMPRLLIVSAYAAYKLLFAVLTDIYFSELPFMSAIGCIRLYLANKAASTLGVVSVAILTAIEVFLVAAIALDMMRTTKVHNQSDYLVHRTKIVGFRFFLHQHLVFYSAFTLIYLLVLFGFPLGVQQLSLWLGETRAAAGLRTAVVRNDGQGSVFDTQYAPVGQYLAILGYATIEAIAKLPAKARLNPFGRGKYTEIGAYACASTARTARGSMGGASRRDAGPEPEPISYRQKERGGESVVSKPNCFTMATHIKMFNLSWYVYYYGTAKEGKLDTNLADHDLAVAACVNNQTTDTRVLVLEAHDRICVAFKGTSSKTNVRADLRVAMRRLRGVLPSNLAEGEVRGDTRKLVNTSSFRRAKIHLGFATAYNSVSSELMKCVRSLLEKKARPVLLTGHSLGGALATIASADLVMQPWWPALRKKQSPMVTTFGSPRVGNPAFRRVYIELKVVNWRVVAGGDVITQLPKFGYAHVGRNVALSVDGALFVDPDALETRLWHRPSASVLHHRKSTYGLALRAWCDKQHGKQQHGFWKFPISKADSKRYEEAFKKGGPSSVAFSTVQVDQQDRERVNKARLKVWADAIDLMEPRSSEKKFSTLELWARLTKPVLADLRAHGEMMMEDEGTLSTALEIMVEPAKE